MGTIWELDFYSRPILDEDGKKLWEVLICESPQQIDRSLDSLFRYSQFCSSKTVNSILLKEALEKAMQQADEPPQKIRFFRRQMNNMITKACDDLGLSVSPSRRTYALQQWIEDRLKNFYPTQSGYDADSAQSPSVQYQSMPPIRLPDAVRGDKGDRWAFVTLEAAAFEEMKEWDIGFREAFPLEMLAVTPEMRIPGLIIFSQRALPLAGWLSGLELSFLKFLDGMLPRLLLETGFNETWILAEMKDKQTISEARGFEDAKEKANNVHFLAVQSSPDAESFAGFWLLRE